MQFLSRFAWTLAATIGVTGAVLACEAPEPCAQEWFSSFNIFEVKLKDASGESFAVKGRHVAKPEDLLGIESVAQHGETTTGAEAILIDGRVLALSNPNAFRADAIHKPMALVRLASELMWRAFPQGESALRTVNPVKIDNGESDVDAGAGFVHMYFRAPWTLEGTVEKLSTGRISYHLRLASKAEPATGAAAGGRFDVTLDGFFDRASSSSLAPSDEKSLRGWKIYGADWELRRPGDAPVTDSPLENKNFATLGELLAYLREWKAKANDIGVADPTRDVSGYWKETCRQNFGLKIEKIAGSQLYSISFCGPGGCTAPGTYRSNSYINQDKEYEIVAADTLRVGSLEGWSTYTRCAPASAAP